ncbi:kynureninase [Gemmatimonadetes bacterium T265]|nr:kynureninase [Gemmatimonadetes bacterium T265]
MPDDPLLRFRPEFPTLARSTYLVSNSLGAMPRAARDRLTEYADAWTDRGVRAWAERWWELPVSVGDEVAPLVGAPAGTVAMTPTVTLAHAAVVSALDFSRGRDTIVMTALDFPSVRYAVEAMAARLGARVVVVPSEDGMTVDADAVCAAVDERTRLVAVSHVLFRSAFVMDAERIVRHAHAAGALVMLDAYHSAGVMPVDVVALGTDFLAGGVLKWLCGGPGGSFLYVSAEAEARAGAPVRPALTGWQAHARPFAFDTAMEWAGGAWGWLGGTPVVPALYAAIEGPRLLAAAGMEAVRAKSVRQTERLVALADARGYPVRAPRDPARRGGTVAFDVPHGYEVAQALLARDVVVDYRPGAGIRVAPHFYTSDEELEAAVGAIDEILATGAWRAYEGPRATVT